MTENLGAGLGEGVKGLVAKWRSGYGVDKNGFHCFSTDCATELETALEAAARLPAVPAYNNEEIAALLSGGRCWIPSEHLPWLTEQLNKLMAVKVAALAPSRQGAGKS